MLTSASPSNQFAQTGHSAASPALDARANILPRVRQLCPAGVTPGAPWRNGVVPLAAYIVYTPTHALGARS